MTDRFVKLQTVHLGVPKTVILSSVILLDMHCISVDTILSWRDSASSGKRKAATPTATVSVSPSPLLPDNVQTRKS